MAATSVQRTHVGLKRKINEDSLLVRSERGLWAVADGMGGHEAGEVASAMAVEALRTLPIVYSLDDLIEEAVAALTRVNDQLVEMGAQGSGDRTIGTTVVGLGIVGNRYRCFWVGDSRAYLLRQGTLHPLSRDHSLVQDLVDAGMLRADEAEGHPNANVITRAVGVDTALKVDQSEGTVEPGDIFLLASDGLTRLVPDAEVAQVLGSNGLDFAADRLIDLVLARGAHDNVTLVLVKP